MNITAPVTFDDLREALRTPTDIHGYVRTHALPLVDAIEAKAGTDQNYAALAQDWLARGGTVILRDEVCEPFRHADFVLAEQGSIADGKRPYAYNDMWMAVDSARHEIVWRRTHPEEADAQDD